MAATPSAAMRARCGRDADEMRTRGKAGDAMRSVWKGFVVRDDDLRAPAVQASRTFERRVSARPPGAVDADDPQNIRGTTVASVHALRAGPDATVSAPRRGAELDDELGPRVFSLDGVLPRPGDAGGLWRADARQVKSLDAHTENPAAARTAS